jgi:glutamine synthetase
MVGQARHRVHLRMQAAAQRDVQLLEAAADRQHRQVQRQRLVQQRKGIGIAGRVMRIARPAAAAFVVLRFDVADRAGQQQAIQPLQPVAGRQRWLQARQHYRGHLGRLGQRAHVLSPATAKR